ncbi:hypothetical protein GR138_12710 [Shinella kummerowiae]|uniref:Lipoprotein n=1 Tax=Shinella kummerowiae TaxID=417745 RepID=A0A6N8SGM9_9HYPH|nr:hypothetical protein [Shinella kummerowiae]MXN46052.1 hypothetical protein [Shinella kummerowiae]
MKRYAMLPLLVLAGCQSDASVRSKPPLQSFSSGKTPDAAVTCLIPSLQENYKAIGAQRFVAQTLAPGKEYDVVPTDGFVNGHYIYTVNVKASGSGSTLSLYKGQAMLPSITRSVEAGIRACL